MARILHDTQSIPSFRAVQSVDRALQILLALAQQPARIRDLSQLIGVDNSTAWRLVQTLAAKRFVRSLPDGSYALGNQLAALGASYLARIDYRETLRPYLEEARDLTGETCVLAMLDGDRAVEVGRAPGTYTLRIAGEVGSDIPLDRGAAGKALLAFQHPAFIERVVAAQRDRAERLAVDLEETHSRGYSISREELTQAVVGVGVPIFLPSEPGVRFSLGVAGPVFRLDGERLQQLAETLKSVVDRISI